jgi:hypothetical protein
MGPGSTSSGGSPGPRPTPERPRTGRCLRPPRWPATSPRSWRCSRATTSNPPTVVDSSQARRLGLPASPSGRTASPAAGGAARIPCTAATGIAPSPTIGGCWRSSAWRVPVGTELAHDPPQAGELRRAFEDFGIEAVARFGAASADRLLADAGIVRNQPPNPRTLTSDQARVQAAICCTLACPPLLPPRVVGDARTWGTDDARAKGGDYFGANYEPRPWVADS